MILRYPQPDSAAAPPTIEVGLRAAYQIITGSPESETSGDVEFVGGESGVALAQVAIVAPEAGKAATWSSRQNQPASGQWSIFFFS